MVYSYTKHIRVTYQSIDNLLKTNEALAQFNITSKKLDQSQKAIARTILVLQGAQNAFGDTEKTINSLSNQIRVFQGSLSNLRLALGDTFAEPFRKALVYVNGVIIALTDVIRMFVDLKTSTGNPLPDGTIIGQMNDELDELENKNGLLSFDKFNVASEGADDGELSITEALTEELNKQIELYEQVKESIGDIQNEAIKIAQKIKDWLAISKGINGEFQTTNPFVQRIYDIIVSIVEIFKVIYPLFENITKILLPIMQDILGVVSSILKPLTKTISHISNLIYDIFKLISPIIDLIVEVLDLLSPILDILNSSVYILSGAFVAALYLILGALIPVVAAFEFLLKIVQTIHEVLAAIMKLDFSNLGSKLNNVWSDWVIDDYVKTLKDFKFSGSFADGGIPRVGTMFVAGEAGAEFVTNLGNGQTGVTNIEQFRTAMLGALLDYNNIVGSSANGGRISVDLNVNPREMARVINPYIKTENARGGNR